MSQTPSNIYIVMAFNGSNCNCCYSDSSEHLLATLDERKARDFIAEKEKERDIFSEKYQKLCDAQVEWEKEHPYPRCDSLRCPNRDLSSEQTKEIRHHNRQIIVEHDKASVAWREEQNKYLSSLFEDVGVPKEEEENYLNFLNGTYGFDPDEVRYDIIKVKFEG